MHCAWKTCSNSCVLAAHRRLTAWPAFLLPYIQRGELRVVGEATPAEFDACRRLLPSFAAAFKVIEIPPFTPKQAVDALDQLAGTWSQNLGVPYERGAVEQVYRLFARFMPYQSFPGRAAGFTVDLFDRAARVKGAKITAQSAVERFIETTGLPELFLRNDLLLEFEQVVRDLESKVIGQSPACRTAASVVTTFKAGLNDPARPGRAAVLRADGCGQNRTGPHDQRLSLRPRREKGPARAFGHERIRRPRCGRSVDRFAQR